MSNITTRVVVNQADAYCSNPVTLTSGMASAKIQFEFSDEWTGLGRTAVFKANNVTKYVILTSTNICSIPSECLVTSSVNIVVGVFGTDGDDIIIPTVYCSLGLIAPGTTVSGSEPGEITQSLYNQVSALLTATSTELANVKETSIKTADATIGTGIGTPTVSVSYSWIDASDHSKGKKATFAFNNLKANGIYSITADTNPSSAHYGRITITMDNGTVINYDALCTIIDEVKTLEASVEAAEASRVSAESGRVSAESTRVSNETSRVSSESSRATAETARVNSETSRVSAENARVTAETGRSTAESSRVSAETSRASAETSRATAESNRVTAESDRETAETNRASAETSRRSAETSRASAETGRANAETSRVASETSRANAETARETAETNRVTAETNRTTAETNRATAETGRVNAETSRVNAETNRVTAETGRVNAETGRVTAEAERVTEFASMRARADTYVANEIVFIYGDTVYENEILYM